MRNFPHNAVNCGVYEFTLSAPLLLSSSFLLSVFAAIQAEEAKVKKSLKDAAKKGHKDVCTILAKEMVRSRKATNKIYASKAQINSVMMQMQNQLGMCCTIGILYCVPEQVVCVTILSLVLKFVCTSHWQVLSLCVRM